MVLGTLSDSEEIGGNTLQKDTMMNRPLLTIEVCFDEYNTVPKDKGALRTIASLIDKQFGTKLKHDGCELIFWQTYESDEACYEKLKDWFDGDMVATFIAEQAALVLEHTVGVHVSIDCDYRFFKNDANKHYYSEADENTFARRIDAEYRAANDMFP